MIRGSWISWSTDAREKIVPTHMCTSRPCGTTVKDNIVREIERRIWSRLWKVTRVLGKLVSIAHKFYSPVVGRNMEINLSFFCSKFREGENWAFGKGMATLIKLVWVLCFQWSLNSTRAIWPFSRKLLGGEAWYHGNRKFQDAARFEWNSRECVK